MFKNMLTFKEEHGYLQSMTSITSQINSLIEWDENGGGLPKSNQFPQ